MNLFLTFKKLFLDWYFVSGTYWINSSKKIKLSHIFYTYSGMLLVALQQHHAIEGVKWYKVNFIVYLFSRVNKWSKIFYFHLYLFKYVLNFVKVVEAVSFFYQAKIYWTFLAFNESETFWTKSTSMLFVIKYSKMINTIIASSPYR